MNSPGSALASLADDGWQAELSVQLVSDGQKTRLRRQAGRGPLYIQKPFYPEGALAHVYLLHPPGGIAGGDQLHIDIEALAGSAGLFTTPAAAKFYRSAGHSALQSQHLRIASGATLEWLPQENLFFSGCSVRLETCVELEPGARFIGWELNCLGRPASGDLFSSGAVDGRLRILRRCPETGAAGPVLLERNLWRSGGPVLSAPWGLAGHAVAGSLYATPADADLLAYVKQRLAHQDGIEQSALTLLDDVLVARVICSSAPAARSWLEQIWQLSRPSVIGSQARRPRIWNT